MMKVIAIGLMLLFLAGAPALAAEAPEPAAAERVLKAKAVRLPDGVVRASWPRTELSVTVDGVSLPTAMGLTSWAAFQPGAHGVMLMSDTVVLEDEVDAAIDAAFAAGLKVTALHNHFMFERPRVFFMHLEGHGEAESLMAGVGSAWDAVRAVRSRSPEPAAGFPGSGPVGRGLDGAAVARVIGAAGEQQGDVFKITIGRSARMDGVAFGGSMGLTTWAAFQGSDELAVVDGDFAMTAAEVQPVLRALRRGGLHVVALHNHMIGETPAYYFVHFWGRGPATALARGLRSALDAQKNAEP